MMMDIQKIAELGIEQSKMLINEKAVDMIDAFDKYEEDQWFTLSVSIKVRKITASTAEVVPRISFSRGKVTEHVAFVYDSEQNDLPGFGLEMVGGGKIRK